MEPSGACQGPGLGPPEPALARRGSWSVPPPNQDTYKSRWTSSLSACFHRLYRWRGQPTTSSSFRPPLL
ncbi:hypothetical protein E2C01_097921 [Portunus trituberculatus]|uniref:Uncharacterized protein n=1 Tax=Portunus trituberculatus TaxID=210409 RepID=A0A5B7K6W6_PORTR|nr:hypothetical protein [Portunus trituberculatus]